MSFLETAAATKFLAAPSGPSVTVWWNGRSRTRQATRPTSNSTTIKPTLWKAKILRPSSRKSSPGSVASWPNNPKPSHRFRTQNRPRNRYEQIGSAGGLTIEPMIVRTLILAVALVLLFVGLFHCLAPSRYQSIARVKIEAIESTSGSVTNYDPFQNEIEL